ncbi:ankyrin, partial [Ascobolus immersus RN42]
AAGEGHLDCVRMLVESFPESVKIQDSYGCTVMNLAASKGHIHTVRFLLEQCGVDVDECGSDGQTSLHLAASSGGPGCIFLVQMLASIFGANIEAVAKDGKTPLLRAASVGALESVKFLVEMQHANVDVRDHHGWTALELARSGKHGAVVELL